MTGRVARMGKN